MLTEGNASGHASTKALVGAIVLLGLLGLFAVLAGSASAANHEPVKVCGDVNVDLDVNAIDATLILQFGAGMISSLANESNADVNDDGDITSVDATLVLQAAAGLIGYAPIDARFNFSLNCG